MSVLAGQRLTAQLFLDNTQRTIPGGYAATTTQTLTPSGSPTTETVYLTAPSNVTLRDGRAYRITLSTLITGSSADKARLWVRRSSLTGPVLLDTQQVSIDLTSSNGRRTYVNVAVNSTGGDLTSAFVATIARASGSAAQVGNAASATSPSYVQIEDIGAATDYPTATSIT